MIGGFDWFGHLLLVGLWLWLFGSDAVDSWYYLRTAWRRWLFERGWR